MSKFMRGIVLTAVLITSLSVNVKADEIRMGVAPGYFIGDETQIPRGAKKELKIQIANTSIVSGGNTNNARYKVDIVAECRNPEHHEKFNDSEKAVMCPSHWISVKDNSFNLAYNESKDVAVEVNVPENSLAGESIAMLNITKSPIPSSDGLSFNVGLVSTIQVPIVFNIVNDKGLVDNKFIPEEKVYRYNIVGDSFNDQANSIDIKWLIKSIFKDGLISTYNYLSYQPLKSARDGIIIYDIPTLYTTSLRNIITKSKITNEKYCTIDKEYEEDLLVDNIELDGKTIHIVCGDEKYKLEFTSTMHSDRFAQQITNIVKNTEEKPTIGYLLDNVQMLKYADQIISDLEFKYSMKNTGEYTTESTGKLEFYNSNNEKLTFNFINTSYDFFPFSRTLVEAGATKEVVCNVPSDVVSTLVGRYKIVAVMEPHDGAEDKREYFVEFRNIRNSAKLIIIITGIVYSILISLLIYMVLKNRRKIRKLINPKSENQVEDLL